MPADTLTAEGIQNVSVGRRSASGGAMWLSLGSWLGPVAMVVVLALPAGYARAQPRVPR